MARLAQATVILEATDTSGSLHQAAESVLVGHPVFIAGAVLDNPKLTWPRRFIGPDKPLGRPLRSSADVIESSPGSDPMRAVKGVSLGTYYAKGAAAAMATPNASALRGLIYTAKTMPRRRQAARTLRVAAWSCQRNKGG